MKDEFRICISSPPDREKLVAEIFFKDEQWAELSQETEKLILELYPNKDKRPWAFEFEEAMEALKSAAAKLTPR
jgi:hypothetical protein